ncbi:ankyrin repeat and SOCS box protein 5b isoform X6 [Pangasianodon hypophthalmus]|uniref:ankyrin repeat and SOCS box protein 5b isoform X6 n=1 Tax=Pangasianodon hypophthalmus TaxID=310915 RepID=UPI002306DE21|nr:ankyrin repeat and SOCS box protein 5b isoform X6 [Pangasianodon hypophthalmus]
MWRVPERSSRPELIITRKERDNTRAQPLELVQQTLQINGLKPGVLEVFLCLFNSREKKREVGEGTTVYSCYNVNATTIDGVTPLFNACSAGSATCTEVLLEHGANPQPEPCQPSPIHEASSKGRTACVEALISWGADVDYDIPHLGTPLYIACASRELQCTRKLLDGGANVQKGRFLDTPLHAAAQKDCPEIVKVLLEFGANINTRNLELQKAVETAPPSSLAERVLMHYEVTPRSLSELCRLCIREYLGRTRLHLIPQLRLPPLLHRFLQHR